MFFQTYNNSEITKNDKIVLFITDYKNPNAVKIRKCTHHFITKNKSRRQNKLLDPTGLKKNNEQCLIMKS